MKQKKIINEPAVGGYGELTNDFFNELKQNCRR